MGPMPSMTTYLPHMKGWEYEDLDIPLRKRLVDGYKTTFEESKKFINECKEYLIVDKEKEFCGVDDNELKQEYLFSTKEIVEEWSLQSDSSHNIGFSTGTFSLTPNKTALFRGVIDNRLPKDGRTARAGWVGLMSPRSLKSFFRRDDKQWDNFTHLVLKVRGDGRTYMITLNTPGNFDINSHDVYTYALFTHGGPYWQYERIPFSKFYFSHRGRIQDKEQMTVLKTKRIQGVAITICDRNDGPFHLELSWIGVLADKTHFEEFAYEMYEVGFNVSG